MAAYRHLLDVMTLDVRPIRWAVHRLRDRLNPLAWYRLAAQARRAGILADMFHNLAFFSSRDFERFDEARFWRDFEHAERQIDLGRYRYREEFERRLVEGA